MAVAVTEEFLDGALRILSGEALEQEKAIIDQNGGASEFVYVEDSVELPDGTVEQYFISLPKDSSTEQIAHAKEQMVERVKAKWTTAYVNDLPDSSFAYIESGGEKDDEGKTTPRSKRHLPYKDKDGNPDEAHVRNALARVDQTDISDSAKKSAKSKLAAAAKKLGIEVSEDKEEEEPTEGEPEPQEKVQEKQPAPEALLFADEQNKRFPMNTLEEISKSTLAFAQTPYTRYTAPQREEILKRLGERARELQQGSGEPVTKDVSDAFDDALDTALDNALLSTIDAVYYAFVRTFAGSWPDYDADALSREDFNTLVGKFGAALSAAYDKLADDDDAARAAAMRAEQLLAKGLTGLISDGIVTQNEVVAASKAGKRHSKADENRLEIMHGAILGLGYNACAPMEDNDDGDADDDNDATSKTKSILSFVSDDGDAVAAIRERFEKSLTDDGFAYAEDSGVITTPDGKTVTIKSVHRGTVTGSPSHTEGEEPNNSDDDDAHKRVKDIQAELATVKAQAETSESELSRVKDEQQQRIAELEAELQEKQAKLDKVARTPREDPLDRKPVKPTDENREAGELTGARKVNKQFTRELRRR